MFVKKRSLKEKRGKGNLGKNAKNTVKRLILLLLCTILYKYKR